MQSFQQQNSISRVYITRMENSMKLQPKDAYVLDPALIGHLAQIYDLSLSIDADNCVGDLESNEHKTHTFDLAMRACNYNRDVALKAGLKSRASLWLSLSALIPHPLIDKCNTQQINSMYSHLQQFLPIAKDTIATLLHELLEGGDSQHFVVVCEILRSANYLEPVCDVGMFSVNQMRSAYLAYIKLLTQLELFTHANEIIKVSTDEGIKSLFPKADNFIVTKCGVCFKELEKSGSWCKNCSRCVSICSLCNKPIRGLLHWCPVCAHGGAT